ncbi:family 78 glycoside hydrolase catalytic domain [Paenibacillus sp. FSL K6-1096]|uniref:family 78 glycoside hydrolase catalytic domain n=1 Tax=Paenibacillus sp. FSL K6-1096 TaxID=2921460 RepID=UPI0030ECB04D
MMLHQERPDTEWTASWIWGGPEDWPRNEWRCFRREVELAAWQGGSAELSITADARYVLYVNGVLCGRGPARSWPEQLSYHVHEVGHLLHSGRNTVAVLVISFGTATFAYVPGRGGLLAQLDTVEAAPDTAGDSDSGGEVRRFVLGTDASWLTAAHGGYERRAPRMSCQLGFAERVDGQRWHPDWAGPLAEAELDAAWEPARVTAGPGEGPWTALVPSSLPELTEQEVWPVRVESLKSVKPVSWTAFLDVRQAMEPGAALHANPVSFAGYAAFTIRAASGCEAVFGFVNGFGPLRGLSVNGRYYSGQEMEGEQPERYQRVLLRQGDNFAAIELAGSDHGAGLHFGIDCPQPFEVVSPLTGRTEPSPFILAGPFGLRTHIDHLADAHPLQEYRGFGGGREWDTAAFPDLGVYEGFRLLQDASGLDAYTDYIRPFEAALTSDCSVFAACVWKSEEVPRPVPAQMHNVCIANPVPAVIGPARPGNPQQEARLLTDTELILDFGREWSGYLTFEVEAQAGAIIDCYGFEYYSKGWRQDTYGLDNTLRYICREGRQSYTSPVRRGLRYVMITVRGADRPVKLYSCRILQSNYPAADIGRFHCSDALLNDIWEISRHTTRVCMEDTFVDCPAYEQVFWVGDSRNAALVNYYLFGAADLVKRCLELVPGSARQTGGLYADQVPGGWSSVIPNWTFFWVTACLEYARHTGDTRFAAGMWPKVRLTLDRYLEHIDSRGLLHIKAWNLLDWAPIEQPNDGIVTHQNAVLVRTLQDAAELAAMGGAAGESGRYRQAATALKEAVNRHLWSEERQAYVDCIYPDGTASVSYSMQTQVMALLCGAAEGERKERLVRYLAGPPGDFVGIGSPFMAFFYYETLAQAGNVQLMLDDMRTVYGQMIEHEATACWEMYPNFKENRANPQLLTRSHCHAWSAAPGYFLGAWVLGIRPAAPGWSRVLISPQPGDLRWAKGAVPLPGGGRIDVEWSIAEEDGAPVFRLEVTAPHDIALDIQPPDGFKPQVSVTVL